MAETSGFFEAELNELTQQYDREYFAEQFAQYFALFIGNGVFANPTNQLQVVAAPAGLNVILKEGWAFIKGQWYHNDSDKELSFAGNYSSNNRIDSVMIRADYLNREILGLYLEGVTEVTRTEVYFDLKVAEVTVPPNASGLSAANITDTRANEDVCGFVASLLELTPTKDLFAQYTKIFELWFEDIQNQLAGDVAGNLQAQIGSLTLLQTVAKSNLVAAINEARINPTFEAIEIFEGTLDDYIVPGFYFCQSSGIVNSNGSSSFAMIVLQCGELVQQVQFALDKGTVATRYFDATWKPWIGVLTGSDIVDNLTSTLTTVALSANQGRVLNEALTTVSRKVATIESTLNGYQKIVYATEEPATVAAGTIVFVYEE